MKLAMLLHAPMHCLYFHQITLGCSEQTTCRKNNLLVAAFLCCRTPRRDNVGWDEVTEERTTDSYPIHKPVQNDEHNYWGF